MTGVFSLAAIVAALQSAGSGIQTDCIVEGEQAPSFVYTIRDRAGGKHDAEFEAMGTSHVLEEGLVFTDTSFSVLRAPPFRDGTPSSELSVSNTGSFDRSGVHFSFVAIAVVDSSRKLGRFNLGLHIGPRDIEASCGNSRPPADEGSNQQ